MKRKLSLTALLAGVAGLLIAAQIAGYLDMQIRASAPGNPASGWQRLWIDTGTTQVHCKTSAGAACFFDSSGSITVGGVNAQTTSYTAVSGDNTKLVTFACGSACTLTLPSSPPSSTWWILTQSTGSGILTVSRNGLNIDGAASNLTVNQDQGTVIYTDGSNYFTERGMGSTGAAITLQTNGTNNGSQTLLNLTAGTNMSIGDNGSGQITFSATGSPAGGGVPTAGWTAHNGILWNDFLTPTQLGFHVIDNSSLNWRILTQSLSGASVYTWTTTLLAHAPNGVNSQTIGIYLYDGTKLIGFETLNQSAGSGGINRLRVERMNSVTSDNSTVAGATANILPFHLMTLRIVKDATHRTFYYWEAGAFVQFYQEAATAFLTETDIGVGGVSATGTSAAAMAAEVVQWTYSSP